MQLKIIFKTALDYFDVFYLFNYNDIDNDSYFGIKFINFSNKNYLKSILDLVK